MRPKPCARLQSRCGRQIKHRLATRHIGPSGRRKVPEHGLRQDGAGYCVWIRRLISHHGANLREYFSRADHSSIQFPLQTRVGTRIRYRRATDSPADTLQAALQQGFHLHPPVGIANGSSGGRGPLCWQGSLRGSQLQQRRVRSWMPPAVRGSEPAIYEGRHQRTDARRHSAKASSTVGEVCLQRSRRPRRKNATAATPPTPVSDCSSFAFYRWELPFLAAGRFLSSDIASLTRGPAAPCFQAHRLMPPRVKQGILRRKPQVHTRCFRTDRRPQLPVPRPRGGEPRHSSEWLEPCRGHQIISPRDISGCETGTSLPPSTPSRL